MFIEPGGVTHVLLQDLDTKTVVFNGPITGVPAATEPLYALAHYGTQAGSAAIEYRLHYIHARRVMPVIS